MAVRNKYAVRNSLSSEAEKIPTKLKSVSLPRKNDLSNRVKRETNAKLREPKTGYLYSSQLLQDDDAYQII